MGRLERGIVGLGVLATLGAEIAREKLNTSSDSEVTDIGVSDNQPGDSGKRIERQVSTAPSSLEERLDGGDATIQELLDNGHDGYTVSIDGPNLHVYSNDGTGNEVLKLTPDGNSWKAHCADGTILRDWANNAGIGLVEPTVTSGTDIETLINSYDQLEKWQAHWAELNTNTASIFEVGAGTTRDNADANTQIDQLTSIHDSELAQFEDIIIRSDNPFVDHSE